MTAGDQVDTSTPNCEGQVITIGIATGATEEVDVSLPTYMPKIDLRIENPVLQLFFLVSGAADYTGSEIFELSMMCIRLADSPTEAGEWAIVDADTVRVFKTGGALAGTIFITYIAAGSIVEKEE